MPGHAGKGITSYCLSDYEPPKEFAQWFSIPRGKEMICQTTQGNDGYVDLYTYKTADYMMTSANDFHPGEPGHQENPFQLTFNAVAQRGSPTPASGCSSAQRGRPTGRATAPCPRSTSTRRSRG